MGHSLGRGSHSLELAGHSWDVQAIAAICGACIFLRTSTERDLTANSVYLKLGINISLTVSIGSAHTGRAEFHTGNIFYHQTR